MNLRDFIFVGIDLHKHTHTAVIKDFTGKTSSNVKKIR